MPEIGNYGQLNASIPLNLKNKSGDENALNKQSTIRSLKDPETQSGKAVIRKDFDGAQKEAGAGFSFNRTFGQVQIPLTKERIEPGIALRENGSSGLVNSGEYTASNKRESFASLVEPTGIDTFQNATEEIGPKRFQLEDKTVENSVAERIDQSIDTLNKRMEELGRSVRFSKDREFDREVITVVNPDSGDIVRQIPTEYAIRVSEGLKSLRGLLFDDKA